MIIKKLLVLLCATFLSLVATAQHREISGTVAGSDGAPLPGVNVTVKGTTAGTVTDAEGKYKLKVAEGSTLVFSAVGMVSFETPAGARAVIDVALEEDVKQLDEVVVNALGEKRSRDKMGVAIPVVSGKSITESGETGLINGLAGKAEGLIITRNGGDPGAGSYIQLRGQSTISGSVQPLIVIDGMPMFNSNIDGSATTGSANNTTYGGSVGGAQQQSRMNDLNPADIANVEILKGASAAALWGSRAANGVIVITTKKGRNTNGKADVSYTGSLSLDQVNKMPELQTRFGQGLDGRFSYGNRVAYGDIIADRTGGNDSPPPQTPTAKPPPPPPPPAGTAYVEFPDGSRRYATANGTAANPHGGKNSRDVFDHAQDIYGIGLTQDHALNVTGGSERNQVLVSYANTNQKGIVKANSDYKRNVIRVNFQTLLTSKLSARFNVNYTNIRSNRAQSGSNLSGILFGQLRTPPDFDNSQWIGAYYDPAGIRTVGKHVAYRSPIGALSNPVYDNPAWTMNRNKNYSVVNRFIGNMELKYDWNSWLTLKLNSGLDTYTDHRTDFIDAQSAGSPGGRYTDLTIFESQWNTNLYAIASRKFSSDFTGSVTAGFNYNAMQYNSVGASVAKFIVPVAPPNLANSPGANRTPFNRAETTKTSAGFFELNGDFLNQLFVTITGRAETASTFGPEAQSLFFYPSVTAAWQFTKLIGRNDIMTFGKLRASFGVVGKQPDAYLNLTKYSEQLAANSWGPRLSGSAYGAGGYATSARAGNPKIKPERKQEFEIGADLRFFKDRITFSATAYENKTTDVILSTQVAPSSGYSERTGNAGMIENKGLEFNLGGSWIKRPEGFSWSSNFIWSAYRNKVLDLAGAQYVFLGGVTDGFSAAVKGQPLGVQWGKYWETDENGKYILDKYGFPQIGANTGVIGNPNPDFRAGAGNNVGYKNFNLYFLFETSAGGQMWNGTRGALYTFGTAKETERLTTVSAADAANLRIADGTVLANVRAGRATQDGGPQGSVQRNGDGTYSFRGTVEDFGGGRVALNQYFYQNAGSGFNVNKPFMESATWTRLRELTLSYSLNSKNFRQFSKLTSVTLAVTGRNLWLWTPS